MSIPYDELVRLMSIAQNPTQPNFGDITGINPSAPAPAPGPNFPFIPQAQGQAQTPAQVSQPVTTVPQTGQTQQNFPTVDVAGQQAPQEPSFAPPELGVKQGPPQTEEERQTRVAGWDQFLSRLTEPGIQSALLTFGTTLLQKQRGETDGGAFGRALQSAMASQIGMKQREAEAARKKKEMQLAERKVATQEKATEADIAQTEAVTGPTVEKIKAQTEKLKKQTEQLGKGGKLTGTAQQVEMLAESLVNTGAAETLDEARIQATDRLKSTQNKTPEQWRADIIADMVEAQSLPGKPLDRETILAIQDNAEQLTRIAFPEQRTQSPGLDMNALSQETGVPVPALEALYANPQAADQFRAAVEPKLGAEAVNRTLEALGIKEE